MVMHGNKKGANHVLYDVAYLGYQAELVFVAQSRRCGRCGRSIRVRGNEQLPAVEKRDGLPALSP